tara:strand:- start:1752 stop:2360 length:609 start_codon:yes stop_codon:yes gene_type:complete
MIKSEILNVTTPRCEFEFAWLVEADTKFETPGVWKVTCLIPADKATQIEEQLTGLLDRWKAQLKAAEPDKKFKLAALPWSYEERDGKPVFAVKTKMKVGGINQQGKQWTNRPPVLQNAQGQPMTEEEKQAVNKMGPGTEGQVFLRCSGYSGNFGVGIKIQPEAAIIHKHVEYSKSATSYGFETQAEEPVACAAPAVSSGDEF